MAQKSQPKPDKKTLSKALQQLADEGITRGKQGLYLHRNGKRIHMCGKFRVKGIAKHLDGTAMGILCCPITAENSNSPVVIPFDALRDMNKLAEMLPLLGVIAPLESHVLKAIAKYIHVVSQLKTCFVLQREGVEWINHGHEKHAIAVCGGRLIAASDIPAVVALKNNSIYAGNGTLTKWRQDVQPILHGNPIPIAVVSAALSAPCKQLFDLPLLSLLLAGSSASGKTTLGRFINSLFGPAHEPYGWSGTANALEALAIRHADAPLVLDEMAEGTAANVLDVIYRINNGMQKARATTDGGLQEIAPIRTVVIACSEVTLAEHAKRGRQPLRQGHEARMPTIALAEQYGCFSTLNGFSDAQSLPSAINQISRECHGVVWPAYMRGLIEQHAKCAKFVAGTRSKYGQEIAAAEHFDALSSLERRVLDGFTTWALAGELAIRLRILPLQENAAVAALRHVYANWLARWRSEARSPQGEVLRHLRDFFQRHATGVFESLETWDQSRRHTAGYATCHKKHGSMFLVHRGYFEQELCTAFSVDDALAALDAARLLVAHEGGRTWLQRMPQQGATSRNMRMRFYAIKDAIRYES